jgi:hypothetical protein
MLHCLELRRLVLVAICWPLCGICYHVLLATFKALVPLHPCDFQVYALFFGLWCVCGLDNVPVFMFVYVFFHLQATTEVSCSK